MERWEVRSFEGGTTLSLSVQWTTLSLSEWRDDGKSVCAMDDTKSVPNGKKRNFYKKLTEAGWGQSWMSKMDKEQDQNGMYVYLFEKHCLRQSSPSSPPSLRIQVSIIIFSPIGT